MILKTNTSCYWNHILNADKKIFNADTNKNHNFLLGFEKVKYKNVKYPLWVVNNFVGNIKISNRQKIPYQILLLYQLHILYQMQKCPKWKHNVPGVHIL